jgi:SAM-dependent methyltransferase
MSQDIFAEWVAALEVRHLAGFRVQEVTRALRALSSAYVERRHALGRGRALDTSGKRAAFALFYAPLHLLTIREVVRALGEPAPPAIVDLGCGTGAAGAAWALRGSEVSGFLGSEVLGFRGSEVPRNLGTPEPRNLGTPEPRTTDVRVTGIDRHPWAVEEARWTYRQLRLKGTARVGDAARFRPPRGDVGIVVAYLLNELTEAARHTVLAALVDASRHGARVLVVEPIARAVAPWWDEAARAVREAGGRADQWRFTLDLPPLLQMLDKAAGLDHRELKARSLFIARNR